MQLFERYLRREAGRCVRDGIRVTVIGRRDRLSPALRAAIAAVERLTRRGRQLHVRLAVDYSAREAIWLAAERTRARRENPAQARDQFARAIRSGRGEPANVPDVDLLVRTGGEQRLSDFLLWECAYAELYFTPTMWPDFEEAELRQALETYRLRDRRFGRIHTAEAG
jgi:undecaprenyl diphosphate synthase